MTRPQLKLVPQNNQGGGGGGRPPGGGDDTFWLDKMTMVKKAYASTAHNVMLVLKHDLNWNGQKDDPIICYDDFAQRVVFLREPPFHHDYRENDIAVKHNPHSSTARNSSQRFIGKEVDDVDLTNTAAWIERSYKGLRPSANTVCEALESIARTHKRHPVRDFLRRRVWDGVERVGRLPDSSISGDRGSPSWLTRYLGADDTEYTRRIGRWWLLSAVARVMQPGCQADYTLIVEGLQGLGKSSGLRALSEPWFSEDLGDIQHMKESQQQLAGVWIIEAGELDAFSRASESAIKKFLSQPFDRYRPPYGRRPKDFPRQCVFAGTTNKRSYLTDVTGNRRYWPVWTTKADVDLIREEREQLWAEALLLYNQGIIWWPKPDETSALSVEQESRLDQDPWVDPVAQWVQSREEKAALERKNGNPESAEAYDVFTSGDVLSALGIEKKNWGDAEAKRVNKIMVVLGRERVKRTLPNGVRSFVYVKPERTHETMAPPPEPPTPTTDAPTTFAFEGDDQADLPFDDGDDDRSHG